MTAPLPFLAGIPPSAEGLAVVSEALAAWLAEAGAPDRAIGHAELLLEEVAMNVIMHGTPPDGAAPDIQLQVALLPAGCRMVVTDNSPPFNPLTSEAGREAASLDGEPGGLGLMLMRRYGQDLDYQRLPGGNRLALTIPF